MGYDEGADAPREHPRYPAHAHRAEHDQVGTQSFGKGDDDLTRVALSQVDDDTDTFGLESPCKSGDHGPLGPQEVRP